MMKMIIMNKYNYAHILKKEEEKTRQLEQEIELLKKN